MPTKKAHIDHSKTPLQIALVLTHSRQRIVHNGSKSIYPTSTLLDSIHLILKQSTLDDNTIQLLMNRGRIINHRSSCDLNNCYGVTLQDVHCKGGEGGYKITLSIDNKGEPSVKGKEIGEGGEGKKEEKVRLN